MDYSNFVRNFYRKALTKLKEFRNYYGKIVNLGNELGISPELLHKEESESMFLPSFSLNIDAPTKDFIKFMDYYVNLMPDLGFVFANKDRINDLYNNAIAMGIIEGDEDTLNYIDSVIEIGINMLERQGILER